MLIPSKAASGGATTGQFLHRASDPYHIPVTGADVFCIPDAVRIPDPSGGAYKPAELWKAKENHPLPKKRGCTKVFTLEEMEEATDMFSDRNLVDKGSFGRVYIACSRLAR